MRKNAGRLAQAGDGGKDRLTALPLPIKSDPHRGELHIMKSLLAASIALLASSAASAAVVTVTGNFSAINWQPFIGTPGPLVDPLTLNFSLTFDTSADINSSTQGFTIYSTSVPVPLEYSWRAALGYLNIGTITDPASCGFGVQDFCFAYNNIVDGIPDSVTQSSGDRTLAFAATIIDNGPAGPLGPGAVPEPASWAMLIAGFGLVGAMARRRRAKLA